MEVLYESIENEVFLQELNVFNNKTIERINQHNNRDTFNDLFISILLAINKFFYVPNENILINKLFFYNQNKSNSCLLENLLKIFNFEGIILANLLIKILIFCFVINR